MAVPAVIVQLLEPTPDPISLLAALAPLPRLVLLDGASDPADLGRFSFLSADPVASLVASAAEWPRVRDTIRRTIREGFPHDPALPPFQGGWAGWLSYELGTAFDRMPRAARDDFAVPDVALALYDWVIAWDHVEGKAWLVSTGMDAHGVLDSGRAALRAEEVQAWIRDTPIATSPAGRQHPPTRVAQTGSPITAFANAPVGLTGDFSPTTYRAAVETIIEHILTGDLFQANLSQRFLAPFTGDPLALYCAMRRHAVAPMAAYLSHERHHILSVSPELFLRHTPATGEVETRPIKGTRPRGADAVTDAALATELLASEKDRAENVMIVDLLRNDLSRVCEPGSVQVPTLCRLDSHATVHHLVSIVTGRLRPPHDALDLLAATFPGGSITGAPKLRATERLAELEPVARGVYCGAIGWIGCDGGLELNIAIRTITLAGGVAAIHAGGGITARSDADEEYRETLDKARALVAALAEVA